MKIIFSIFLIVICFSCSQNSDNKEGDNLYCPKEIKEKNYCDLYNKAKWYFYASNSHGKFEYSVNFGKLIVLEDVLSVELELRSWREFKDTIEFTFGPAKKYDMTSFRQSFISFSFGFSKKSRALIFRMSARRYGGGIIEPKYNGYVFYTGDKFCLLLDSI